MCVAEAHKDNVVKYNDNDVESNPQKEIFLTNIKGKYLNQKEIIVST